MLGVRERAEAEQDGLRAPAGSDAHVVPGLHVVDDPREPRRSARRPGRTTKPIAAWIAPSTVRDAERDDEHDPDETELGHEVGRCTLRRAARTIASSPPPSARDRGRQRERDDARAGAADADRRGRDLAAAQRVEVRGRSCRSRTQITTMLTIARMTRRQHEEAPCRSCVEVDRARSAGAGPRSGSVPPPTQPNCTITCSKKNANASVASDRKMPPSRSAGSASSAPTAAGDAARR